MTDLPKPQYQPLHCILPQQSPLGCLYLGDIKAASDLSLLALKSITTVITAADGFDHLKYPSTINHIRYPLLDTKSQLISKYFHASFGIIEAGREGGNVLVHCAAGVSRSATLVIAYLMYKKGWGFKRTIEFVREKRSVVCPNLGFEMQLKEYERVACCRNTSSKSTIIKTKSLAKKELPNNLPDIYPKPKSNKYLKFKRCSMEIRKPDRQLYLESILNYQDNFRVHQLRTPISCKSQQLHKPLQRLKPRSSQLLTKFSSS